MDLHCCICRQDRIFWPDSDRWLVLIHLGITGVFCCVTCLEFCLETYLDGGDGRIYLGVSGLIAILMLHRPKLFSYDDRLYK